MYIPPNMMSLSSFIIYTLKLFLPCTIIGDFNLVLDQVDRSPVRSLVLTPSAKAMKHLMTELEMIDI